MKRLFLNRWTQLIAALVLLAVFSALFTWLADHLPPRPRMSLPLDDTVIVIPDIDKAIVTPVILPDGKRMVAVTNNPKLSTEESALVLWNLETGKHSRLASFDFADARDIEFSPDSKLLATKSKGNELKIWDTSNGKLRLEKVVKVVDDNRNPFGPDNYVYTRFSPDGRYLLYQPRATNDPIVFWDLKTDQERTRIDGSLEELHFAPDGKRFALLDRRYQDFVAKDCLNLSFWEMPAGDALPRLLKRQQIAVGEAAFHKAFVFSNDLQTCAFACTHNDAPNETEIQLWDLSTSEKKTRLICRYTEPGSFHFDEGRRDFSLEFSPNGRFLMAVFEGGEFNKNGGFVVSHVKHVTWNMQGEVQAVHFLRRESLVSPCGRWLLTPDETGTDVWEVGTQRKTAELRRQGDYDPGQGMGDTWWLSPSTLIQPATYRFTSDGHFVMVTGFQTTTTPNLMEMVLTRQWSRINTPETVAVGRLWDVERGEEIATFLHCSSAWFSPDGHTLVTLDDNNHLQFWTVPPRRPVGFILALTTVTWGLVLLVCWWTKRRYRRWHRSSSAGVSPPVVPVS